MVISDYNTQAFTKVPVIIDVKKLSGGLYTVVFTSTTSKSLFKARFIVVK